MRFLQSIWLFIIILGIYQDTLGKKPVLIPPKDELMLREGDELKLDCYGGNASLHFSFPEYTFMSPRSTHEISVAQNGTLTFLRRKTVFLDTGWYACAAKGVEIENDFKTLNHTHEDIAWLYVYVSSSEPFADRYYTFPKVIIILAGSPTIVPCRPTSPKLVVQLWKNFQIMHDNQQLWFDPKIGFVMQPAATGDYEDIFQCKVNGVEDNYSLRYVYAKWQKPTMTPAVDEIVLHEGEELRIECYFESSDRIPQLEFSRDSSRWPHMRIISSLAYGINSRSDGKLNATYIIPNIVPQFTGWYGCTSEGFPNGILSFVQNYNIDYTRKEINWIYVYVESNAKKLLGIATSLNFVKYMDGTSVVVPCYSTSPNFDVRLERESKIVEMDENVRFDPKLGFVMRRGPNLPLNCYVCVSDIDSEVSTCLDKLPEKYAAPNPIITHGYDVKSRGENVDLDCEAESATLFRIEWKIPNTVPKERVEFIQTRYLVPISGLEGIVNRLKLINVTEDDSGEYSCVTRNTWSVMETTEIIRICDPNRSYTLLNASSEKRTYIKLREQNVKWKIENLWTLTLSSVEWFSPFKQRIDPETEFKFNKYKFCFTNNKFLGIMEIRNLTFDDSGEYEVRTYHGSMNHTQYVTLDVQGTPIVSIQNESEPYYAAPGRAFLTICHIIGSPKPNITWIFVKHRNSSSDNNSSFVNSTNYENVPGNRSNTMFSYLNMSTEMSGILICAACNFFNCSQVTKRIIVSDGVGRFGIIGPKADPHLGDDIALTCAGSINVFTNLIWDKEFDECCEIVSCEPFYVEEYQTQFTIRSVLHIKHLTRCHQRWYSCLGQTIDGNNESSSYYLRIPRKPNFTRSNLNHTKIIFDPVLNGKKTLRMSCCVDGEPEPNLTWFKNNLRLEESHEYHFVPQNCELTVVLDLFESNGGRYKCRSENQFGSVDRWIDIVVGEETKGDNLFIGIISLIVFLIAILVASLVIWKHRIKESKRRTKKAILERFDRGALDCLDPTLDVVDQAELLPYDEKWEFPRELLKLEVVLGSGAFGIVRRAQAKSICPREPVTTVAVKMVQASFKLHQITALSRELKVLIYLGQHVNIVNLLGACTKNVNYGELFVIVEFCRFGNLQEYLSRSRADFINQIDELTDEIIGPHHRAPRSSVNRNCVTEVSSGNSNTRSSCRGSVSTPTNEAADDEVPSHIPAESELPSKYESDNQDSILEPISTKDLLCWAWQVARGMEYLGRRKVVHGDLAARNILLADNNVIKICDFGMARALANDDGYREAGDTPLPLKWMAVESIKERIFSIQSDVWSYGIVLWEFFSLAESLYPGIHPKFLYEKLINGHRMDRPKYAPKNIYRMMLKCWEAEPTQRPTFAGIERELGELLDYDVKTYYAELDGLYTDVDHEIEETSERNYLTVDPSQNVSVSFSVDQNQIEISNRPSQESPDPVDPGPSSAAKINLFIPNSD